MPNPTSLTVEQRHEQAAEKFAAEWYEPFDADWRRYVAHSFARFEADHLTSTDRLRDALELALTGGNHLANVLIGQIGAGFAERYPPDMDPQVALHSLCATDTYDVWCCWSSIMRVREALTSTPAPSGEREALAERVSDAVAEALASISVAYTHVTLMDMSMAGRSWKVHKVVPGENPFDRNEWLGEFDNKADANALAAKLRREAAIDATRAALQGHAS